MNEKFNIDEYYYMIDELLRITLNCGWNADSIAAETDTNKDEVIELIYFNKLDNFKLLLFLLDIGLEVDKERTMFLIKNCFLK